MKKKEKQSKMKVDKKRDKDTDDSESIRKRLEQPIEQKPDESHHEDTNDHASDSDDDDEDLLEAAAASWAASAHVTADPQQSSNKHVDDGRTKTKDRPPKGNAIMSNLMSIQQQQIYLSQAGTKSRNKLRSSDRDSFSLHITQLPYTCTEMDIREVFGKIGCSSSIIDIRMVYDNKPLPSSESKNQPAQTSTKITKKFRGVAFVDLSDAGAYAMAMEELHNKAKVGDRVINVRPVKTKEELAVIVQATKESVRKQILEEKTRKLEENQKDDTKKTGKSIDKNNKKRKSDQSLPRSDGSNKKMKKKKTQQDDKGSKDSKTKKVHDKESKNSRTKDHNLPTPVESKELKQKKIRSTESKNSRTKDQSLLSPSIIKKVEKAKKRRSRKSNSQTGSDINESENKDMVGEAHPVKIDKSKQTQKNRTVSPSKDKNKKSGKKSSIQSKTPSSKAERNRKAAILQNRK